MTAPAGIPALVTALEAAYPAAFDRERRPPLKVGIHRDLGAAHREWDAAEIGRALRWWTSHVDYLDSLAARRPRVDLHGSPGDLPAEADAAQARGSAAVIRARLRWAEGVRRCEEIVAHHEVGQEVSGADLAALLALLDGRADGAAVRARLAGGRVSITKSLVVTYPNGRKSFGPGEFVGPRPMPQPGSAVAPRRDARAEVEPALPPIAWEITARSCRVTAAIPAPRFPAAAALCGEETKVVLAAPNVSMTAVVKARSARKVAEAAASDPAGFAVVQGTLEGDGVLSEAAVAFQASSGEGEAAQDR
jgi:hypothetical protein